MSPLVSVIVANHNRAELLRECVASLVRQTHQELEILVVDNGSTDGSVESIRSLRHPRIRILELPENQGFARANNLGIQQARGRYVALLNNDAVASPDWLSHLVRAMESDPSIGMCASKILFVESDVIDKAGHLIFPDGQNRGRGTGERDCGQYDRCEEGIFADGCAALYRKSMLGELAGFDEDFFAYGEDADLGIRAQWLGWRCLYVPEARVEHHHSSTLGRFSPQKIYWIERNRLWLAVKNFPAPLLLLSPALTAYRMGWNLAAALLHRGAAGNFRHKDSLSSLVGAVARAYWDGSLALGRMMRKRRQIRKNRRISTADFYRLLRRHRISARTLAFQDTR